LILNAGGRYDNYSSFGDTINPRVAVIYSPWQTTTIKWLYGEAYRAPNVSEWGYIGPGWTNSPGLMAETIDSYEMVWEQGLTRSLSLNASVFLNQVHGLIDATTRDDLQYYANLEDAESRGFEVGLEGRWEHGLRGSVSYTYADANYDHSTRPFSNSPRHMAKLNVAVPVWREKVFAGFEIQGMSSRLTELGNETAGFAVANLTLFSRQLVKNLDFSASVYNILDKRYWDPGEPGLGEDSLQQDGRTFRVKLAYRF
jgi:outer membrane receptor for ferrienterochelin and colicins